MTILDSTAAFITSSFSRAVDALPKTLAVGAIGAGLTLAAMAMKVSLVALNPVAAGVFCASTYFLNKTFISTLADKVFTANVTDDSKKLASTIVSFAVVAYAMSQLAPAMVVDASKGVLIYGASILTISLLP